MKMEHGVSCPSCGERIKVDVSISSDRKASRDGETVVNVHVDSEAFVRDLRDHLREHPLRRLA